MILLLLENQGDEVKITEEVVKAAAGNGNGGRVMALLLKKRGDEVKITQEVVKAAAANKQSGKDVVDLLVAPQRMDIFSTQDVVISAASASG